MTFLLNGVELNVVVIRKPNKNLYMRLKDSKTISVTCHKWVSEKEIFRILEKNKNSLERMVMLKQKEEEKNAFFQYLGKNYIPLFDGKSEVSFAKDHVIAKNETMLNQFFKDECKRVFEMELNRFLPYFPNIPNFDLKIRFMKTRWGVNNQLSKTITLNSELLKKDLDLLDYVIIHELCHFYEANHSSRFWEHVSKYYPKYKEARRRLRE